jgi:hypothetical protein
MFDNGFLISWAKAEANWLGCFLTILVLAGEGNKFADNGLLSSFLTFLMIVLWLILLISAGMMTIDSKKLGAEKIFLSMTAKLHSLN